MQPEYKIKSTRTNSVTLTPALLTLATNRGREEVVFAIDKFGLKGTIRSAGNWNSNE